MAIFVGNLSNVTSVNADDYVYIYDGENIKKITVADFDTSIITNCYFEYGGKRMTFTELIENLLFKLSEGTGYISVGNIKEWIKAGMPSYTSLASTSAGSTSIGSGVTMEAEDDSAETDSDDSTIGKLGMEDSGDSDDGLDGDSDNEETANDSEDSDGKDSIEPKEHMSEDE